MVNRASIDRYKALMLLEQAQKSNTSKIKVGKLRRHQKLRRKLNSQGFGKPWEGDCSWFRVEFAYYDKDTEEEDNFQEPHWVSCRKFKGEERRFLAEHAREYQQRDLIERETIESVYVCLYVANFLCYLAFGEKYDTKVHAKLPPDFSREVNQAFIYPASSKHNDTFRDPLYLLRINPTMCSAIPEGVAASLRNAISHE